MQDLLMHLGEIENQLIMSRPVGGLPNTAKEQLDKFMVTNCLDFSFWRFCVDFYADNF